MVSLNVGNKKEISTLTNEIVVLLPSSESCDRLNA